MPVPERSAAVERQLLRDSAYGTLRDAIVCGTLAPGEVLHDTELCDWLGLSRTPVREALGRLSDDGLVEMVPQRYTRVAPVTRREVREACGLLAVVHALATELAVPRLDHGAIAVLRQANDAFIRALREEDPPASHAADEQFHRVFVGAAAHAEVDRVLARLEPRVQRCARLLPGALPGRRSAAEHEAAIARAEAGDATGAASAVRENWRTLGALLERALVRDGLAT
jgi:DNA-binding GntR family transcriptional regulator